MAEEVRKIDPKYLTDNHLWDSSWLKEKYPARFDPYPDYDLDDDLADIEDFRDRQYDEMYGENYRMDIFP